MLINSHYEFVTKWEFAAPQAQVWQQLNSPESWPLWWRGVEQVELLNKGTDELGHGAVRRYTWRSRLPYRLTFLMQTTRVEPFSRIEGHATGELEGSGRWHLCHSEGVTRVRYDWQVKANKRWMRLLAPVARSIFAWNHDIVMEWGRLGLIRRLKSSPQGG